MKINSVHCANPHVNICFFLLLFLAATWQKITQVLIGLSDTLGLYPPPSGAVDPLPSPSESPHQGRKSTIESPFSLSSPAFSSSSSG